MTAKPLIRRCAFLHILLILFDSCDVIPITSRQGSERSPTRDHYVPPSVRHPGSPQCGQGIFSHCCRTHHQGIGARSMCTDAHMKTHIALALLALVLLFLVDPNCLVAAACGNFELDRLSPDSIDTQFSGAIIKLTTSDGSGTGYLVDAEHGYILTAAHVIPKVSAPLIKGSTKSLPKQILSLRLKAIERDPKADLAVLQIDGDNVLKTLRPLDISLRAPRRGKFYAMAYPVDSDTVSAGTYKAREVDLSEVNYQSGTIRVHQAAYSADSGGPLIDLTGTVVATNHGKIGPDNPEAGAPRSSYILLANGIDLIEKSIEPTARVKQLDD